MSCSELYVRPRELGQRTLKQLLVRPKRIKTSSSSDGQGVSVSCLPCARPLVPEFQGRSSELEALRKAQRTHQTRGGRSISGRGVGAGLAGFAGGCGKSSRSSHGQNQIGHRHNIARLSSLGSKPRERSAGRQAPVSGSTRAGCSGCH